MNPMIAESRSLRNVSRRLVIELAVVVLLVGLPIDFPRDASSGRAWSFLVRHPSVLLHAVIGTLILLEAAVFLVRVIPTRRPREMLVAGTGLASAMLAVAAGLTYVSARQSGTALSLMTVGWLGAIVTYIVGWALGRRGVRAGQRAVAVR